MAVIAKFKVQRIGTREDVWAGPDPHYNVFLAPVGGDSPENKEFFKWSPSGEIDITTKQKAFMERFPVGREFYVRFFKPEEIEKIDGSAYRFRVRVLGNENDDGSKKLYNVELRGQDNTFVASHVKLSTINEGAAVCFLGFGEVFVTFEEASSRV